MNHRAVQKKMKRERVGTYIYIYIYWLGNLRASYLLMLRCASITACRLICAQDELKKLKSDNARQVCC